MEFINWNCKIFHNTCPGRHHMNKLYTLLLRLLTSHHILPWISSRGTTTPLGTRLWTKRRVTLLSATTSAQSEYLPHSRVSSFFCFCWVQLQPSVVWSWNLDDCHSPWYRRMWRNAGIDLGCWGVVPQKSSALSKGQLETAQINVRSCTWRNCDCLLIFRTETMAFSYLRRLCVIGKKTQNGTPW